MNFGLKPTEHDPRDFSYHKTFGASTLQLPNEYFAGRPKIKDQKLSQMCTAFASYVLAACEDGVDFLPEWSFAAGKTISKSGPEEPEDLRTPIKTAVGLGYLESAPCYPSLETQSPLYCGILANYEAPERVSTISLAAKYKKKSYFRVDGDFDTVKRVLFENATSKRAILTGVQWYNEWTMAPNGFIPDNAVEIAGLHCVPLIGFVTKGLSGAEYIVVQNSVGEGYGDKGLFYFDRETFNKHFTEPMYMLVDMDDLYTPNPIGNWFSILLFNFLRRF